MQRDGERTAEPIEFYFDFVSPYGYLGSVAVERLAARLDRRVVWRPVLLGITVLKVMGLKALPDTPLKRDYVRHDLARFARLLDLSFDPCPAPMQPLPAMRAFTWLAEQDPALASRFGLAVFRAHWGAATDMSSPHAVAELAASLGADREAVLAAIDSVAVKDALRQQVDSAIAAGVFGVPTFVVDAEMFWGTDRLPMVERWITTGGW
jgi:2-hydroxychromene-2-carboxylate isomerase